MSIHIQQVLDYLETNLVMKKVNSMESLLGTLYDVYAANNCFDSQESWKLFQKMRTALEKLPQNDSDAIFHSVCDLCMEHEQTAFSQGILTGMLLMTEINWIP